MPGPGYYDIINPLSNIEKMAVTSSMFKSDSVRELSLIKRGPGPAHYEMPNIDDKNVGTLNPKRKWVWMGTLNIHKNIKLIIIIIISLLNQI
jgi:Sperm-tail PG-rich repeat